MQGKSQIIQIPPGNKRQRKRRDAQTPADEARRSLLLCVARRAENIIRGIYLSRRCKKNEF